MDGADVNRVSAMRWLRHSMLSLVLFAYAIPVAAGPVYPSQDAPPESRVLAQDGPIVVTTRTGEAQLFRMMLEVAQYLELEIDPRGIDLAVTLRGPDRKPLTARDYRQAGRIMLAAVTRTAGIHWVDVRALETASVTGQYVMTVRALGPAGPRERQRVRAADLLAQADRARAVWDVSAAAGLLRRYRAALAAWAATGDREWQAVCARKLGETHQLLGEPDAALRQFEESVRLAQLAGSADGECAAQSDAARVLLDLGRHADSRVRAARAVDLARGSGDRTCESEALNVTGDIAMFTGEERNSADIYRQALAISRELGDRRGEAQALLNLAYTATDLSHVADARQFYNEALEQWRAVGDRRGEAATLVGLANLDIMTGASTAALGRFREARPILEKLGDHVGLATMLSSTGTVLARVGEFEASVGYYRRSARLFNEVKLAIGEATTLLPLGLALERLGRYQEALDEYTRALNLITSLDDRRLESYAREHLARLAVRMGRTEEAVDQYSRARSLASAVGNSSGEAYALSGLGMVLAQQGRAAEGLTLLTESVAVAEKAREPFAASQALFSRADVKSGLGDVDGALADIRRSLEIVENLRGDIGSLDLRASYVASVRDRHDLEIELLTRLDEREPSRGYVALAFEASERARARSLLDGLTEARAGIRVGVDATLVDRERALLEELNVRALRLARVPLDVAHQKERDALTSQIDALTGDSRDLEAQIRTASPAYAALTQPRPLTLHQVQQLVADDDTVLLEYFVGDRRSYVWAVTRTGIAIAALPPRAEIERLVRPYIQAVGRLARDQPAVAQSAIGSDDRPQRVSAMLLGPIADRVRVRRLLVVPDGILHTLPFAALPDPGASSADGGAAAPLIDSHELVLLPSASTLALLRRDWHHDGTWPRAVMVFADPVFDADDPRLDRRAAGVGRASPAGTPLALSNDEGPGTLRQLDEPATNGIARLLGSRREARAIAAAAPGVDVALDFAASRAAVMNGRLADYRILHFATHGVVDNHRPALSGIVLSLFDAEGRSAPGFLRLHDIYNLQLPVDLVVLSACSTGLGKEVAGEGLMGLVRGFMYAGSRQVLATLWKVDDQATSELMTRFYDGVLRRGLRPVTALAEAQRQMMRDPRWRDPFYWAPFVLQGDWQ
jgi:CHAT domain-containing protein/tetratricopeptide (TPR) repeat protein